MMDSALKWITTLSLIALAAISWAGSASILTNEDIVRMTASRLPESEIVKAIEKADEVAFDLSSDVVDEMKLVGVTARVIEAMQAKAGRPASNESAAGPMEGTVEIVFTQKETAESKKKPGLPLPRAALFLLCVEPTHVPDYWTTKTPLSQKFPRHDLLWFHEPPLIAADAGTAGHDKSRSLPLPAPARVTLEAGEHPIQTGIAVWAPDQTWIPLAVKSRKLNVIAGETVRLVVSVAVHKMSAKEPVTIEIVEPAPDPSDGQSSPP